MFTIVMSRTTISWARPTTPRISQRRGSGVAAGPAAPALAAAPAVVAAPLVAAPALVAPVVAAAPAVVPCLFPSGVLIVGLLSGGVISVSGESVTRTGEVVST